jgi:hypothetical protein
VLVGRSAGVVEAAPEGDNGVGVADGKDCAGADPEQAETDKDASMVKLAQPTASLAPGLVPVMVVRILMGSSCLRKMADTFPGPGTGRKSRPGQEGPAAIKVKHIDGADVQWPVHHWNIRLRD